MPLMNGSSKKSFSHNVGAEERAGKPAKQALAIAYAVKRKNAKKMAAGGSVDTEDEEYGPGSPKYEDMSPKLNDSWEVINSRRREADAQAKVSQGMAHGGMVDNEKMHPDHEPFGVRSTHDIVRDIMRKRQGPQGAQPPEYLDDGGMVGDDDGMTASVEPMDQRVNQRQGQRGEERNMMQHPNIAPGRYDFSGTPTVVMSNKAAQERAQQAQDASYDPRVDARLRERAQMKAYGGQVTDEPEGKGDFLSLSDHDGQDEFHVEQDAEDPKMKRRKMLSSIMNDLHNEHYGR